MSESSIEVTTRYSTSVGDLSAAWAFVMEHVDHVGPDPTVEIKPFWVVSEADEVPRKFGVVVEGMVTSDE